MGDLCKGKVVLNNGWSWEENKLFEVALTVVDERDPRRWEVVAAMVGGKKSAEDVQKRYVILLQDLQLIESGQIDHKFPGLGFFGFEQQPQPSCPRLKLQLDFTAPTSLYWTGHDQR